MSLATATSTEGKGGHPARPADGTYLPGISGMHMTPEQIRTVERLRYAAEEHGEVSDLLFMLSQAVRDEDGKLILKADAGLSSYLRTALIAARFVNYDKTDTMHPKASGLDI